MPKSFYIAGLAMGILAAYFLRHFSEQYTTPVALMIVVLAYALFGHKPRQKPVDYSKSPAPNTRRWARQLYQNKLISLEELQRFYDVHPEEEDFSDDV